jgi:hypothetical protein
MTSHIATSRPLLRLTSTTLWRCWQHTRESLDRLPLLTMERLPSGTSERGGLHGTPHISGPERVTFTFTASANANMPVRRTRTLTARLENLDTFSPSSSKSTSPPAVSRPQPQRIDISLELSIPTNDDHRYPPNLRGYR